MAALGLHRLIYHRLITFYIFLGICYGFFNTPTRFYTENLDYIYSKTSVRGSRAGPIMASIGNGFLGSIIYSDTIHVSGVYNGRAHSRKWPIYPVYWNDHTHCARIPSTCAINYTVHNLNGSHSYALDVRDAVFYHWFRTKNSNFTIEQRLYAHREFKHLLIVEFTVRNMLGMDVYINLTKNMGQPSRDIVFKEYRYKESVKVAVGQIKRSEDRNGFQTKVAMVWNEMPSHLVIKSSQKKKKWFFITALTTNINYKLADVVEQAKTHWNDAVREKRKLLASHKKAWRSLWETGSIDIEGNLDLSQAVYGSMYYILSSIRSDWPYGISPGGLPGGEEYMGHTFWDQDIWMYPFLVLLYPDLARSCLQYRYERLPAARLLAQKYGFEGAMFPWESSLTGLETSPGIYYGECQVHITGDVAHAAKLYWRANKDYQWLKDIGYQLAIQTAEFWATRAYRNNQKYVIEYVMSPDEFHFPVDNSVYTNVIAKQNLQFAVMVSKILGRQYPRRWNRIIDKMYIPFDKKLNYHPEFDGFNLNMTVKQADTILIGYPLMYNMEKQVRWNDLSYYTNITSKYGPAMTHSMHAIGWLELGQEKRAFEALQRNFDNIVGPFKVWTELINKRGAVNFITGAGGFLQAILFGYGGFRLRDKYLEFHPTLPPTCSKLTIRGVSYLGNNLHFTIKKKLCRVKLISKGKISPHLEMITGRRIYRLKVGNSISFVRGRAVIRMAKIQ